jgi:NADH-quinone oxidoreductase subunit J
VIWWLFIILSVLTVMSAPAVIASRSPMYSAMALVATFFFLAGIYAMLLAHTIAVLQVLVYAGAIMVLFLFVIMLLLAGERRERPRSPPRVGVAVAAGLFVLVVIAGSPADHQPPAASARSSRSARSSTRSGSCPSRRCRCSSWWPWSVRWWSPSLESEEAQRWNTRFRSRTS